MIYQLANRNTFDGLYAIGVPNPVTAVLDFGFDIDATIFALYLLRPAKRAEILERWQKSG